MTTQPRIGWIGLGRMGEAMVKKLRVADYSVQVWNRTREKALPLAEYGAVIVDNKLELAGCDVVFTMVSTTDDLKEVLFGEGGADVAEEALLLADDGARPHDAQPADGLPRREAARVQRRDGGLVELE